MLKWDKIPGLLPAFPYCEWQILGGWGLETKLGICSELSYLRNPSHSPLSFHSLYIPVSPLMTPLNLPSPLTSPSSLTSPLSLSLLPPPSISFISLSFLSSLSSLSSLPPARSPLYSHISSTLQGLPTIRTFGNQSIALDHFHQYQNEHTQVITWSMENFLLAFL